MSKKGTSDVDSKNKKLEKKRTNTKSIRSNNITNNSVVDRKSLLNKSYSSNPTLFSLNYINETITTHFTCIDKNLKSIYTNIFFSISK